MSIYFEYTFQYFQTVFKCSLGAYVVGGNAWDEGDKFSLEQYDPLMDQWTVLGKELDPNQI